jgi:hypothetical protein
LRYSRPLVAVAVARGHRILSVDVLCLLKAVGLLIMDMDTDTDTTAVDAEVVAVAAAEWWSAHRRSRP